MSTNQELRHALDRQLRGAVHLRLPAGAWEERDGPVRRYLGMGPGGLVLYSDLGGLAGEELDRLIRRQQDRFTALGQGFEWKTYAHDQPPDLPSRLRALGFVPEATENVAIGLVAEQALAPISLPEGVTLRAATSLADLHRLAQLLTMVFGEPREFLAEVFWAEMEANPADVVVLLVEAQGEVVGGARVELCPGTEFATLWSGATHPAWRGRGLYKAMVRHRARLAQARGLRYLEVDALEASRVILERLGFRTVTTTTPYNWTPPAPVREREA